MEQTDKENENGKYGNEQYKLTIFLIICSSLFVVVILIILFRSFIYQPWPRMKDIINFGDNKNVATIPSILQTTGNANALMTNTSKSCMSDDQAKQLSLLYKMGLSFSMLHVDFNIDQKIDQNKLPPVFIALAKVLKNGYRALNAKPNEIGSLPNYFTLPCINVGTGNTDTSNADIKNLTTIANVSIYPDVIVLDGNNFVVSRNVHDTIINLGYNLVYRKTIGTGINSTASVVYCANKSAWKSNDDAIKIYDLSASGPTKELDPMHAIVSKFLFVSNRKDSSINLDLIAYDKSEHAKKIVQDIITADKPELENSSVLEKAVDITAMPNKTNETEKTKSIIWQNIVYDNNNDWTLNYGVMNLGDQRIVLESRGYREYKESNDKNSIWYKGPASSIGLLVYTNLANYLKELESVGICANLSIFRVE